MSDTILKIIPTAYEYVPNTAARKLARETLQKRLGCANIVNEDISEQVKFHDAGSNLESIKCPCCNQEISITWWQHAMEQAHVVNFSNLNVSCPNCENAVSLNELNYSWPCGFSRYSLRLTNPSIHSSDISLMDLENILGAELKIIEAHY